ncbi:uncharacterized protein LOC110462377 [Mizuhopecten yessoensis]|uniref:uncharacterized protein LOC110462377 n=1 Tax=Mizuhopecten yessoensis TaxID=6573 RepID=UPI000B4572C2|nr:uncharacterized protein LOC110462377 [Mizuhopecten yessoensis]
MSNAKAGGSSKTTPQPTASSRPPNTDMQESSEEESNFPGPNNTSTVINVPESREGGTRYTRGSSITSPSTTHSAKMPESRLGNTNAPSTLFYHIINKQRSPQNQLQRGFTEGTSPLNACLLVEECINEAFDFNKPLALTTLDATRAFDVVWHDGLLRTLYQAGVQQELWGLIKELQTEFYSAAKYEGRLGPTLKVNQGIRQGAKRSPIIYKTFSNDILNHIRDNGLGAYIGNIFIGAPTVADEISLVHDNPVEMQTN